jgi:hypothetical protein
MGEKDSGGNWNLGGHVLKHQEMLLEIPYLSVHHD